MNDKKCFICKDSGILPQGKLHLDLVYDGRGNTQAIPLCYVHSVEFFKHGQKHFLAKYSCLSGIMEDFQTSTTRNYLWENR